MEKKIDLVIPMVFPQDPKWQKAYKATMGCSDATGHARYRSWGTEELLVRCCMKYMPWLRSIHILLASESQAEYLNGLDRLNGANGQDNPLSPLSPSLHYVFHRDFIPEQYLPTFNVNTIEMWLHRIPGLSEYFIYSNDDLFPLSPLQPEDFFQPREDGGILPCQTLYERPYPTSPNTFPKLVKNGLDLVAEDFGVKYKKTWLRTGHSMAPMLKSMVEQVCTMHADRILQGFTNKRDPKNFNQYIFQFYQHFSGKYIEHVPSRHYVGPKVPVKDIVAILREPAAGVVCINDSRKIADWERRAEIVRREISARLES